MDFTELLDHRRSVRAYEKSGLDHSAAEKILHAIRMAPSAGDLQSYRIALVENPDTKAALGEAALGQEFVAQAAAVLVFFADVERAAAKYHERGRNLFSLQDATVAAAYAQLAATDLGLAACWVGAFRDEEVCRAVAAPAGLRPVAMLIVGKAAEAPVRPPRRRMEELVVHERFER